MQPPLGLTVPQAITRYGPPARKKLQADFAVAHLQYPPAKLELVCLKEERKLLLYASDAGTPKPVLIHSYPLSSFSGTIGPKLREGDLQIPEGIYRITGQRADFRLGLCVDYPNQFDRAKAKAEQRSNLGSNILVHGGTASTGCVLVSNEDMADIFTAVHDTGCSKTRLLIAPCDMLHTKPPIDFSKQPKWLPHLYKNISEELKAVESP